MTTACDLCSQKLPAFPISESELCFCCAGCHAVYKILDAKNQLDNFQEHPVFKQALKSGLISNPLLLEHLRRSKADQVANEREKLCFEIGEMWCPSCAEVIRLILLQERGVLDCHVDYATDLASIEFSPRAISKESLFKIIADLGYQPSLLEDGIQKAVSKDLTLRFIIAAFCALNVMMFAYPLYATYFDADEEGVGSLFAWMSCLVSLPVVTYSAWPILRRFWNGLRVGIWGMESLVIMGVAAAFALSMAELLAGGTRVYFDSMTVVIAFVLLGRMIEAKAKFSAKETLLRLARSLPRRGRKRFPDGTQRFVPIKEIAPGDILVVLSGEKVVLDGAVIEGEGCCNEALMTGEALPVDKKEGSKLLGGTLLLQGWLVYRVATNPEESALHRIIASVEQEIGTKSMPLRAVDRIVRWFVPLVIGLALLTALGCLLLGINDPGKTPLQTSILRAVAVLLISCPCAIGIAAPLAEAHLMNSLAHLGVIVRNRGALQHLGREGLFAFDKTGTITRGEFTLLDGLETLTLAQQAVLKSLAEHSSHPICMALARAIPVPSVPLDEVEEVIGKGMKGRSGDAVYRLGSATFLNVQDNHDEVSSLFFSENGRLTAELKLNDKVRDGASALLQKLAPVPCVLLSGDGEGPVEAVARQCGFQEWRWRVTPLEKREYLLAQREKGLIVCMVGDGINDAPALTSAHVGISVVTASDISIHVSDLLLTTDRLEIIPKMRELARRGSRIVKQNLFWAFFYNVIGIALASFGLLSPLFAAGAMVASSLIVTLNAQRLKNSPL